MIMVVVGKLSYLVALALWRKHLFNPKEYWFFPNMMIENLSHSRDAFPIGTIDALEILATRCKNAICIRNQRRQCWSRQGNIKLRFFIIPIIASYYVPLIWFTCIVLQIMHIWQVQVHEKLLQIYLSIQR